MATDTSKITGAADDLSDKLTKGGSAAKTLGGEIASAISSLDDRISALEASNVTPPPINEYGKVTNFTAANAAQFQTGGIATENQNANKSWSLQNPDEYSLRFEVRSGDVWASGYDPAGSERNECGLAPVYNQGDLLNVEFIVTVLPGSPITAGWLTLVQLHATSNTPPCPFVIALCGNPDRWQIILQSPQGGNNYIYTGPSAIERNRPYHIKAQVKMGVSSNGTVKVWLDDNQIVNFTGNVGSSSGQYWWKFGAYRGTAKETFAVLFKNFHIWTD